MIKTVKSALKHPFVVRASLLTKTVLCILFSVVADSAHASFSENDKNFSLFNNSSWAQQYIYSPSSVETGQSFEVGSSGKLESIGVVNALTSSCRFRVYEGDGFSGEILYEATHTLKKHTLDDSSQSYYKLKYFDLDPLHAPEVIADTKYTISFFGCNRRILHAENFPRGFNYTGGSYHDGGTANNSRHLQFIIYRRLSPVIHSISDMTATEDSLTSLDLGSLKFSNSKKITFSVDRGLLFATDGDGSTESVTVTGSNDLSGSKSITFSGTQVALENYLATSSKLKFLGDLNSTDTALLTATASDDEESSSPKLSKIVVTPVQDPPSIIGVDGVTTTTSILTGRAILFSADSLEIIDPDSETLDGYSLKVEITANGEATEDILDISTTSTEEISISSGPTATTVRVRGTPIGTFTDTIELGNTLNIELNSFSTLDKTLSLLKSIEYRNSAGADGTASTRVVEVSLSDGKFDSEISSLDLVVLSRDNDARILPSGDIVEPVPLPSTSNSSSTPVGLLDFEITDGGTTDGLFAGLTSLELATSGTLDPSLLEFTLSGAGMTTAVGSYADETITFSGLNLGVSDGASGVFSVSARFKSATPKVADGETLLLSFNGAESVTLASGSTRITGSTPITNGSGSTVSVVATELQFISNPGDAVSGALFDTPIEVAATDAYGNVDVDWSGTIKFEAKEGRGSLMGTATTSTTRGRATVDDAYFDALADKTTVAIGATVYGGSSAGTLIEGVSDSFVVGVEATKLVFINAKAFATWGQPSEFSGPVVIHAVDANGILDTDYEEDVVLSAAWEAANGIILLKRAADDDGIAQTETITAVDGVVSVSGLSATILNYGLPSTQIKASSGSLSSAISSALNVASPVATGTRSEKPGSTLLPRNTAGQSIARITPNGSTPATPFIGQSFTATNTGTLTTLELALGYGNNTNCLLEVTDAEGAQLHLEAFRIAGSYTAAAGTEPGSRREYPLADGGVPVEAGASYTFTLSYCTFPIDYYQADTDADSAYTGGRAIIGGAATTGADLAFAAIITEPTAITGLPSSINAVEDEALALAFDDIAITGSNSLTLSVDRGQLRPTDGTGTFAGVRVSAGTGLIELQGTSDALMSFLADSTRMTFTSSTDDSSDATLTFRPAFNLEGGETRTVAIAVTAVNDAPTIERFGVTNTSFGEDTKTALSFPALNFDDADDDSLTVTLSTDKGLLFATDGAETGKVDGITLRTPGSESGKSSIQLSGIDGKLKDYFNSAGKFEFQPALDDTDDHTLTISFTDGIAAPQSLSTVLEITPVRDSPRIEAGEFASQTILEDESRVLDFSDWDIRAPDSGRVTFTLTALGDEASFTIDGGNRSGFFVTVTGSGTSSLSISASIDFLMATIKENDITLIPKANASGSFFFGVTLSDENGPADLDTGVGAWIRTPVDDLPVLSNLHGDASNYVPGFGAQRLDIEADAEVSDVEISLGEADSLAGHSLHVETASNREATEDLLSIDSDDVLSRTGDSVGSSVAVGGVTIGTLNSAISTGNSLSVALNSAATLSRVQTLIRGVTYTNQLGEMATNSTRGIDFWISNAAGTASNKSRVSLRVQKPNSNGLVTSASAVAEPVVVSTAAASTAILDFTLVDGGGDGYPLAIGSLTFRLSGSVDPRALEFTLDGPGVTGSERIGSYTHALGTVDFPASFEIADGASAVYTLSVAFDDSSKAYGSTEGSNLIVSATPASDFNTSDGATGFAEGSVTLNGTGTTFDIVATELVFLSAPETAVSGTAFAQQPRVAARDGFGNTDTDFTGALSLSATVGGGSLFGVLTETAVAGIASFSGTGYAAASDGESFRLSVDDEADAGSDLEATSTGLLASDIRASQLMFVTQPGPARVNTSFGTRRDPVVHAVDVNGALDRDFENTVTLSRVGGSGYTIVYSPFLSSTDDSLGVITTAVDGVATFSGLRIGYAPNKADDSFRYRAAAEELASVDSDTITANAVPSATSLRAGPSAEEDVTSALDLSSAGIFDLDGETVVVTFSIDRGKLIAPSGDGTLAGVTVSGSGGSVGSESISFSGTPSALTAYFDRESILAYRSPLNDSTNATLSLAIRDDEISGTTRTSTVTVAAVNDAPTITNIEGEIVNYDTAYGEWILDNEREAVVDDIDSDNFDGGFLRVAITENKQATEDQLTFTDFLGKGISFDADAGSIVFIDWTTAIGTLEHDIGPGNDLVVNFNSAATPARVQELVQAVSYNNVGAGTASTAPRTVTMTVSDGSAQNSYSLTLNTIVRDRDATLSATSSPIRTATITSDSVVFTPALDFTVTDGGTADGIDTRITRVIFEVEEGIEARHLEAQLSGPGLSPVLAEETGAGLAFDLTAAPLRVADGSSTDYTISVRLKVGIAIADRTAIVLKISDIQMPEVATDSTLLSFDEPLSLRSTVTVDVLASTYKFAAQPLDAASGELFVGGLVVEAIDAAGNRDTDYTGRVQLSTSASGEIVNSSAVAVGGRADFAETYYIASKDNETLSFTAGDMPSAGTDISSVSSMSFTSRVEATSLKFSTQPSPLTVIAGSTTQFTDSPIVAAVGVGDVVDEDFTGEIELSGYVYSPTAGATLLSVGESSVENAQFAIAGLADFSGLELVFAAPSGGAGYYYLAAEAEGLSSATSANIVKADIAVFSGTDESINVDEETLTSLDYSSLTLASKDNESIQLTFTVDKGTLSTLDAAGTVDGVEISEVTEIDGESSVSFSGTGSALTTYLRKPGSLKFQSDRDQRDASLLEVHASNGSFSRKISETIITINPLNDAPALSGIASATQTYTQGSGAVNLAALSSAVFSDPDSGLSSSSSIEVEITSNLVSSEDRLALQLGGEANITVATGEDAGIRIDGRLVARLAAPFAAGGKMSISVPPTTANADVQVLLRAISYENTNTLSPTASTRQLTITLSDGEASSSYNLNIEVKATPVERDEAESDSEDGAEGEADAGSDAESGPESDSGVASAAGTDLEAELDSDADSDSDSEADTEPEEESGSEGETDSELMVETKPESSVVSGPVQAPDLPTAPLALGGLETRYPLKLVIESGIPPYSAFLAHPKLGHLRIEGNVIFLRGIRDGATDIEVMDSEGERITAALEFRPWEKAYSASGFSNFRGPASAANFLGGVSRDSGVIYRQTENFSVGDTFHLFFHISPREQDLMQEVSFVVAVINGSRPEEVLLLNNDGSTVPFNGEDIVAFDAGVLTQESTIDVTSNQPLELTTDLVGDWYVFVGYALPSGEIIYPQEATQLRVR